MIRCYQRYVSTTSTHLKWCECHISVVSIVWVTIKIMINEFDSYPYLYGSLDFDTPHHLVPPIRCDSNDTSKDIFFSPTVTGTLDLVFIESQAAGVAVVGPRAVAVPLVVTDGVNGRRGGKVGKGESEGVEVRQNCFILVQNLKFHFGRMSHCC